MVVLCGDLDGWLMELYFGRSDKRRFSIELLGGQVALYCVCALSIMVYPLRSVFLSEE